MCQRVRTLPTPDYLSCDDDRDCPHRQVCVHNICEDPPTYLEPVPGELDDNALLPSRTCCDYREQRNCESCRSCWWDEETNRCWNYSPVTGKEEEECHDIECPATPY